VLAALRAGIRTVCCLCANKRDLEEIPADAREQLTFVWVEPGGRSGAAALAPAPAGGTARRAVHPPG